MTSVLNSELLGRTSSPQTPYPDMLFHIYGFCSANTQAELEGYAQRAAKRQGTLNEEILQQTLRYN